VHLAPQRPAVVVEVRDPREGPKKSRYPFERIFVDLRYLDAKPGGVQLYSCTLLEGLSRTILAGSLTTDQEAGVLLHVYFQALLCWGLWEEVISDHGGQFRDHDWIRVNKRLGIHHDMYPKDYLPIGKVWEKVRALGRACQVAWEEVSLPLNRRRQVITLLSGTTPRFSGWHRTRLYC
jgi:hypothetical protein